MERALGLVVVAGILIAPVLSFASCISEGATVIYVNGILTSKGNAKDDTGLLGGVYEIKTGRKDIKFINGYNESHLAGGADILQSIAQTFGSSISDFDLKTILIQIHPQVTTQKILLVGHSQGTFYTNALYEYLTKHGVSPASIAVYNLATPAGVVAGNGNYLTSANDKLIYRLREVNAKYGAVQPLAANVIIPLPKGEENDEWGGHHFSSSYLGGAPGRIVSDISKTLNALKPGNAAGEGCFEPPERNLAYKAQELAFKVADPAAVAAKPAAIAVAKAAAPVGQFASSAVNFLAYEQEWLSKEIELVFSGPSNRKTAAAFSIAKALYGSSLEQSDVADLLNEGQAGAAAAPPAAKRPPPAPRKPPPAPQAPPENPPPAPESDDSAAKPDVQTCDEGGGECGVGGDEGAATISPGTTNDASSGASSSAGSGGPGASAQTDTTSASSTQASSTTSGSGSPQASSGQATSSAVSLAIVSPADHSFFATTSVAFAGTTTAGALVFAAYGATTATTTADAGEWAFSFVLPEGNHQLSFSASDDAGNSSATSTRSVTVDLSAPVAPALAIEECAYSLSSGFCLLATTTVSVSWDVASGASHYGLWKNGALLATTTATTSAAVAIENATTTFSVVAYDMAGHAATSTEQEAFVSLRPLIINEIAWMGTKASSEDEWIEVKNVSPYTLDLSRVTLAASDGAPYIPLSGTLAPSIAKEKDGIHPNFNNPHITDGFFLIERRSEVVSLALSGGGMAVAFDQLSDSGEELRLHWETGSGTTTVDTTPALAVCNGWCAGGIDLFLGHSLYVGTTTAHRTMERARAAGDGALAASWQDNDAYSRTSGDAGNNIISGTPGWQNSAGIGDIAWYCSPDVLPPSPGGSYKPMTSECTYFSRFIRESTFRGAALYRGTPGAASRVSKGAFSFDGTIKVITVDDLSSIVGAAPTNPASTGERFFIAVWGDGGPPGSNSYGVYIKDFDSYFQTGLDTNGNATPPHHHYRTFEWTWGP